MDELTFLIAWAWVLTAALTGLLGYVAYLAVRRYVPPVAHTADRLVHTAPGRVASLALAASIAAGPLDAHPDSYAARAAALSPPLYSDPTTTPGGTR